MFIRLITESNLDAAYLEAVGRRDMETAQRMVDAAAKAAGYDIGPVWHGTDAGNFNEFKTGQTGFRGLLLSTTKIRSSGLFFSQSEDDALGYGKNVRRFFLRATNMMMSPDQIPASTRMSNADRANMERVWREAEYVLEPLIYLFGGRKHIDINNGVSNTEVDSDGDWIRKIFNGGAIDWSALDNPLVVKRMRELGYDSVLVYEPNDISGKSWFVTNPNQIKSADPVTYDNNGNVIPLSQRFNQQSNDIRY